MRCISPTTSRVSFTTMPLLPNGVRSCTHLKSGRRSSTAVMRDWRFSDGSFPRSVVHDRDFSSPLVTNLFCGVWRGEDLVADSIVNKLGERMQAKLEHDFRPVRLYGPDGNS